MKSQRTTCLVVAVCTVLLLGSDWRCFRGPNGGGVAHEKSELPIEWDQQNNIAWKTKLPGRGLSGPIVVGDRVAVTCCSGYRQNQLHVVCFSVTSGAKLWERQFWATGSSMTHPKTCPAAPTPTSDGQRIFACFSSNDVVCLDWDGNLLWLRGLMLQLPNVRNSLGMASSPIVVGDTLIVKSDTDTQSVVLGLDTATGTTRWQADRPPFTSWSSPVRLRGKGDRSLVVLQSGRGLTAYDSGTGQQAWHWDRGCDTMASSVADGDSLYVPSNGLVALSLQPGRRAPEILWESSRLSPSTSSPLCYEGLVYVVSRSVLKCGDARTGQLVWQLRLKGDFSSSPVVASGRLYIFNEEGLGQVVTVGPEHGRVVGGGNLGETILCSPAVAGGALYVRSDRHLWKIAKGP